MSRKIAGDVFQRQIGDGAVLAGRAQQHAHAFAARHQLARHVAAEKARRSGDESGHQACAPSSQSPRIVRAKPGDPAPL